MNVFDKMGVVELFGTDVDGKLGQIEAAFRPTDKLVTGLQQHPATDIDDQIGLFGNRNKFCR